MNLKKYILVGKTSLYIVLIGYIVLTSSTCNPSSTSTTTVASGTVSTLAGSSASLLPIQTVNNTYIVSTFAGSGTAGTINGTGTAAQFNAPSDVIYASDGTIYTADYNGNVIRKITQTGVVTTLAGSGIAGSTDGTGIGATFNNPSGLALSLDGTILYVAENTGNKIRKIITATGVVTTIALTGAFATLNAPSDIDIDASGNLYVADANNHCIKKIDAAGAVTIIAGLSGTPGTADGIGTASRFNTPYALDVDGTTGNLYVADSKNYMIRKIVISTGAVTTLAGTAGTAGKSDGSQYNATFGELWGMYIDANSNLYVTDKTYNRICKVTSVGVVTTIAGSGIAGSTDNSSTTLGTTATFNGPSGIGGKSDGSVLYVTDYTGNKIRKMIPNSYTSTSGASGNGTGTAAKFNNPSDIVMTSDGATLYVADYTSNLIRKIVTSTGVVTILAGSGIASSIDGIGEAATFNNPSALALSANGLTLYVAEYTGNKIRKIATSTGSVTTMTLTGTAASFKGISDIDIDTSSSGNLYVADALNHCIKKIDGSGAVTILAGKIGTAGTSDGIGSAATFNTPYAVDVDGTTGNLYVADSKNYTIRKIVIATGVVTTLAGTAGTTGKADGTGTNTIFGELWGIYIDASSNLYVTDKTNNLIRKVTSAGVVTTIAGSGSAVSSDGIGIGAAFNGPSGISGNSAASILYVTDYVGNVIRKIIQ